MAEKRLEDDPYRPLKMLDVTGFFLLAVSMLVYGLLFDRRTAAGSVYVFVYAFGYYFGKRSGLSKNQPGD